MGRWADFCAALFPAPPSPGEERTFPEASRDDGSSGNKQGGADGLGSGGARASGAAGSASTGSAVAGSTVSGTAVTGSAGTGSAVTGSSSSSSSSEGKGVDAAGLGGGRGGEGPVSSWAVGWLLVSGLGLLLRFATGLASYSGQGQPPKYGDYEAQRHWMEVTLHLPVREWYAGGPLNDLAWWGLDYPPLTAYQSYAHGLILNATCPEAVALLSSRGFESPFSKVVMRWTVVLSDALVFFPAAVAFVSTFHAAQPRGAKTWLLCLLLLQPGLILIDHGHFQYNCISLGLTLWAATLICAGHLCLGSVFFCLAINHKHMSLYYAPAFFGHLLGRCVRSRAPVALFLQLGLTVVATFAAVWWPFLSPPEATLQVLHRLVPLARGLFEDHVANFWCVTSVLVKWKRLLPVPALARVALFTTVAAATPPMVHQILRPSREGLLLALLNSSFAFFFFAFQVHEKAILLPLLPATMLGLAHPRLARWLAPLASFSMFPLLVRDGLAVPYVALTLLFLLFSPPPAPAPATSAPTGCRHLAGREGSTWQARVDWLAQLWAKQETSVAVALGAAMLTLHILRETVAPPARLPYLHAALFVTLSFFGFVAVFAFSTYLQWTLVPGDDPWGPGTAKRKLE